METSYVYHRRPAELHGSVIHPLNQMFEQLPGAYRGAAAKYHGREALMDSRIPLLDCRWNDAVHLAPVRPGLIYQALVAAGGQPEPGVLFFRIPIARIVPHPTVVLDFSSRDGVTLDVRRVDWFQPDEYHELAALPIATADYYRHEIRRGRRPLLFAQIPHVLVRGSVDIDGVEVIAWDS